jgi:hypothetical protein
MREVSKGVTTPSHSAPAHDLCRKCDILVDGMMAMRLYLLNVILSQSAPIPHALLEGFRAAHTHPGADYSHVFSDSKHSRSASRAPCSGIFLLVLFHHGDVVGGDDDVRKTMVFELSLIIMATT